MVERQSLKNTTNIWPIESIEESGKIITSAMIETGRGKSFHLWFSVPIERKDDLTEMSDPFVIASIFYAMGNSDRMIVHGQVSPSLLKNLEEFQGAWINWSPQKYKKIEISAANESEADDVNKTDKAIMAFSGGLDSCFTAYRHKNETCGRQKRNITAGVMVHGFDISLKDEETFRSAAEKSRKIINSVGMQLIPITTNFRDIGDDWNIVHEAGIAASLALFGNGFRCGVISSSFSYDSFNLNIPWGSNPLTDSLLSSSSFEIFNDGSMFNRTDKLELLTKWPQAMEYMRVCWKGEKLDRNCCECEKCIRNILSFYAIGIKPAKCFPLDITKQQIENIYVPDLAILFEYRCMLWAARKRMIKDKWVNSLEICIKKNEKRLNGRGINWDIIRKNIAIRTRVRNFFNGYSFSKNANILEGALK
ncbi:MAG: hypothetical protein A2Y10_03225 [Planctomycetes bacterium GWF2_41_51]|nr:MAG: hypothetical protein A2Y10_03225 [Planctomycetes bacterium GWF2_41_51]HBG28285.1 hypothetical protein [Phycisphaerales bacterium]